MYGPGGKWIAHQVDEFVEVAAVIEAEVYGEAALRFFAGAAVRVRAVPRNDLTDVAGIRVGHHHRTGRGWRTGTTVVLPPAGTIAGVDVRGGAPGTRETDALDPRNLVPHIHAVCLSGGSAFGLAAAGVMAWLEEHGRRVPRRPGGGPGRADRAGRRPLRPRSRRGVRQSARRRVRSAGRRRRATRRRFVEGNVGAGAGADAGAGGIGSASQVSDDGMTSPPWSPSTPSAHCSIRPPAPLWAPTGGIQGTEYAGVSKTAIRRPTLRQPPGSPWPPAAPTTSNAALAIVATNVTLTKAQ